MDGKARDSFTDVNDQPNKQNNTSDLRDGAEQGKMVEQDEKCHHEKPNSDNKTEYSIGRISDANNPSEFPVKNIERESNSNTKVARRDEKKSDESTKGHDESTSLTQNVTGHAGSIPMMEQKPSNKKDAKSNKNKTKTTTAKSTVKSPNATESFSGKRGV